MLREPEPCPREGLWQKQLLWSKQDRMEEWNLSNWELCCGSCWSLGEKPGYKGLQSDTLIQPVFVPSCTTLNLCSRVANLGRIMDAMARRGGEIAARGLSLFTVTETMLLSLLRCRSGKENIKSNFRNLIEGRDVLGESSPCSWQHEIPYEVSLKDSYSIYRMLCGESPSLTRASKQLRQFPVLVLVWGSIFVPTLRCYIC